MHAFIMIDWKEKTVTRQRIYGECVCMDEVDKMLNGHQLIYIVFISNGCKYSTYLR